MKLAIGASLDPKTGQPDIPFILRAEDLGYDSVWTAETWGLDGLSPLAFIAAHTRRIKLGTAVAHVDGRSAATLAMTAQTIDALAGGGRMRLGIGMSGPQVAEGWHGRAWGRPNYRLRDTVAILRKVWSGERVAHDGKEIQLPYQGPGSSGLGKPIRNAFSPVAPIPILIGAETPLNVRMTGEIADGLITFEGEPKQVAGWRPLLEEGFARRGSRPEAFELYSSVRVLETDDVKGAIEAEKKGVAMYIGGFGASSINFHRDAMAAKGYPEAARRVQELFLAGRRDEAAEAVPDDYIDERMLIGAPARIRERFGPWRDSGFTTLAIRTGNPDMLEMLAKENAG